MRLSHLLSALVLSAALLSAAEADAARIRANLDARHLPFGAVIDPIFSTPESDEIIGYTRCGDSAIWTGHLLAAESFRYATTHSPESLDAVKQSLEAIRKLIDVTGKDLLARCAFPANWPYAAGIVEEERSHGVYSGIVNGEQWLWIGDTSRDQYLGVYFGLTAAWNLVDDQNVRGGVGWLAKRMLDNLVSHGWVVVMPDGALSTTFLHRPDQQLALLKLGSRVGSRGYTANYKTLSLTASAATYLPIATEALDPYGAYFKFNLDHITFYCLLSAGDPGFVADNYKRSFEALRDATRSHQNAFFNLIERSVTAPNATRDAETVALLDAYLQRPPRDQFVDLRGLVSMCADDRSCDPIPVPQRVPTDFVWQRSPFQLSGGGSGRLESPGVDYLLPYWMARYFKLVTD